MRPIAARVALAWASRKADLSPPLGYPGGSCHAIERIEKNTRGVRDREDLISKIERGHPGTELSKEDTAKIYRDVEMERGAQGTQFRWVALTRHAQYRMDLRGVTVGDILAALADFHQAWAKEKSKGTPKSREWERAVQMQSEVEWMHKGLVVGFRIIDLRSGRGAQINTVFWQGSGHPKAVTRSECSPFQGWVKKDDRSEFERLFRTAGQDFSLWVREADPSSVVRRFLGGETP
jgi:hypothetical protein